MGGTLGPDPTVRICIQVLPLARKTGTAGQLAREKWEHQEQYRKPKKKF